MKDVLITFGDSVKALEDGRVAGYLVRFSTEQDTDITAKRDFFTAETDFDLKRSTACTLYYDHGLDSTLKKRDIGLGEMKVDTVGVWVEAQLNLRDEYEAAIYKMAKAGKLGWSSGTASHLVIREQKNNGAHQIKKWPLGLDASLTPTPAEPRNDAFAVKRVCTLAEYVDAMKGPEMPKPEVKGLFTEALAECMSPWMLQDALYSALRKIQEGAEAARALGQPMDAEAMVAAVLEEYFAKLQTWAVAFVGQGEEDESGASVSMKKVFAVAGESLAHLKTALEKDLPIEAHTDMVESAVVGFAKNAQALHSIVEGLGERWEARTSSRIKAGRKLSQSNREKMAKACSKLKACGEIMGLVHDELMKLGMDEEPENGTKSAPVSTTAEEQMELELLALEFETLKTLATAGVKKL